MIKYSNNNEFIISYESRRQTFPLELIFIPFFITFHLCRSSLERSVKRKGNLDTFLLTCIIIICNWDSSDNNEKWHTEMSSFFKFTSSSIFQSILYINTVMEITCEFLFLLFFSLIIIFQLSRPHDECFCCHRRHFNSTQRGAAMMNLQNFCMLINRQATDNE